MPRPIRMAASRSARRPVNSSATDSWTWNRLADVQASPMLRILAITAPSTAASRSASSKTTNGALPPSSIETCSTWSAAWASSPLPTSVEPVKDSFRSRGSVSSGSTTERAERDGDHVEDARRQARLLEDPGEGQHRQRRELGGLHDHRAARGDGRADLAGAHRHREVPRRDEQAWPHRLAHREEPALARRVRWRTARRCARPPRRTSGGTRPRRPPRPATRRAACPSPASSAGRARRPAP